MTSNYPYQEVDLSGFKTLRAFCLLLVLTFGVLQAFQWAYGVFDQKTMLLFNTCWGVLLAGCLYLLLTKAIDIDHISRLVNKKATYESVLYTVLKSVCEPGDESKTKPLMAYLKRIQTDRGDHKEHLCNLPQGTAKHLYDACLELIQNEKLDLSQKLQRDIEGQTIYVKATDILQLESIASVLLTQAPWTTSSSDRPKIEPRMTGMATEA